MFIAVRTTASGIVATELDDAGAVLASVTLDPSAFASWAAGREPERPRWVWNDTAAWYPGLLAAGVRVERVSTCGCAT